MRPFIAVLIALSAAPHAIAAAVPVDSTITAVTVYTDRAVVTRSASVKLDAGLAELQFANLPQSLNDNSLQVSGGGSSQATILDVSAKKTYQDFVANPRLKEVTDQLRELQKQMRGLDDHAGVLQSQGKMLDQMEAALFAPPAKDVPRPDLAQFTNAMTYLSEQRTRILADRAALDEQREDLNNRMNTLRTQLNDLRSATNRGTKSVTVRVNAAQAGTLDLSLSYTVPGAGWVPTYDARLDSGGRSVALAYAGIVRQSTGEDWKDVAMTLSTARPALGGAAPALRVWSVDVFTPPTPRVAAAPAAAGMDKTDAKARRDRALNKDGSNAQVNMQELTNNAPAATESEAGLPAEMAAASVEAGATSASFKIATPASIPSDNTPQTVPITATKLAANPEYLTTPKLQATAFLTAKVENSSDFPLLAGSMNVFLDGTFVAISALRTVMPGEKFDLALGADEGIAVKYKRVNRFAENTGLTGSGRRVTFEYLITVQNNKQAPSRVIVADQVPLSRNEQISVRLLAPDLKPSDEGTIKWTLDLKPGEKRELPLKFAVDYPGSIQVEGLD
jgi:uncharacterized protein (TIGR02231 family)